LAAAVALVLVEAAAEARSFQCGGRFCVHADLDGRRDHDWCDPHCVQNVLCTFQFRSQNIIPPHVLGWRH